MKKVILLSDKNRIDEISKKFKVTEHTVGGQRFKAVEGIDHNDMEWAIEKLQEYDEANEEMAVALYNARKEITLTKGGKVNSSKEITLNRGDEVNGL